MSWTQTAFGPVFVHPSGWQYVNGRWMAPVAAQGIITHPIAGSSQVSMQFGVGQAGDMYGSLSASQQSQFNQALYGWVLRNGASCQVADTSSIKSPADIADPVNRQLALECFRGANNIQSSTSGLDQQTYNTVLNAGGVTPVSVGSDTTPSWLIPVGIGVLALVAGIGVAYVVTRPPKTHDELVKEIYGTAQENPRRYYHRSRLGPPLKWHENDTGKWDALGEHDKSFTIEGPRWTGRTGYVVYKGSAVGAFNGHKIGRANTKSAAISIARKHNV